MTKTSKEILIGARDLIDANGLARHAFEQNGCFCTIGAIIKQIEPNVTMIENTLDNIIVYSDLVYTPEVSSLTSDLGFTSTFEVFRWNDHATKEEVIEKFNTAIGNL